MEWTTWERGLHTAPGVYGGRRGDWRIVRGSAGVEVWFRPRGYKTRGKWIQTAKTVAAAKAVAEELTEA